MNLTDFLNSKKTFLLLKGLSKIRPIGKNSNKYMYGYNIFTLEETENAVTINLYEGSTKSAYVFTSIKEFFEWIIEREKVRFDTTSEYLREGDEVPLEDANGSSDKLSNTA